MKKSILVLFTLWGILPSVGLAQHEPQKTAIIKADDVRRPTEKWRHFVDVSLERGVKVSLGIICDSLDDAAQDYLDWIRALDQSGQVEFWNHGWDHKRWTDDQGNSLREFHRTGYDHQKKHYNDAKVIMTEVFGSPPVAFGSPFNSIDEDTVKVMSEDPDLQIFFGHNAKGMKDILLAPLAIRGEHDGTGQPNFAKFKEDYVKNPTLSFAAIQFHPNNFSEEHFGEYTEILDFLLSEGWVFVLPKELPSRQKSCQ